MYGADRGGGRGRYTFALLSEYDGFSSSQQVMLMFFSSLLARDQRWQWRWQRKQVDGDAKGAGCGSDAISSFGENERFTV